MPMFDKPHKMLTAIICAAMFLIVAFFAYDDYRAGKEQSTLETEANIPVLLPLAGVDNILVEHITNEIDETWLTFHVKRQLILNKDEFNDCGGSNLPQSLKPFRQDLLALSGVENLDIRAYEFVVQKARAFTWEEIEVSVKELITKQYPFIAVADTTKPEDAQ